jgi:HEAT repeat protein
MRRWVALAIGAGIAAAALAWHSWRRPVPPSFHPSLLPRSDPAARAAVADIEALSALRARRRIPMGATGDPEARAHLDRLHAAPDGALFLLEEAALDRALDPSLRVDLLNVVAARPGEETRRFLSALFGAAGEDPAVRIAALEPLMAYRDAETFDLLRTAYLDPAPFDGRYHVVRALGESGRPEALPLVRDALGAGRAPSLRCAGATALGAFVAGPEVRSELSGLAFGDPDPAVRLNALLALARSDAPEAEEALRRAAAGGDPEARRAAARLLEGRERKP